MKPHALETLTFETGDVLIATGGAPDSAYVLLAGSACVQDDVAAPPLIVGPGEMVGDVDLVRGQVHSASVVALEPISAVRLTRQQLSTALHGAPTPSAEESHRMLADFARNVAGRLSAAAAAAPQWVAIVVSAESRDLARQIGNPRLTRNDLPFVIGRTPGRREAAPRSRVNLILPDAKPYNMSRRHFIIDFDSDGPIVRDAGSLLGTAVNGVRIGAGRPSNVAPLNFGDNRIIAGTSNSPFHFTVTIETG